MASNLGAHGIPMIIGTEYGNAMFHGYTTRERLPSTGHHGAGTIMRMPSRIIFRCLLATRALAIGFSRIRTMSTLRGTTGGATYEDPYSQYSWDPYTAWYYATYYGTEVEPA
jgi:hypothetical protein